MTEILLCHDSEQIATLTLNHPAARNALSIGLMAALDAEFAATTEDHAVLEVTIAANAPAFYVGQNVREIGATPTREAYESDLPPCAPAWRGASSAACSRLSQRRTASPPRRAVS